MENNNKKEGITDRIRVFARSKNMSMRAFSSSVGVSHTTLSMKGSIGSDKVERILNAYKELNPYWLLGGKGNMLIVSNSNQHSDLNTEQSISKSETRIPLLPMEAIAGSGSGDWTVMVNDLMDQYVIPEFNDADFMIRVKGSSMYPKYKSGDIVPCKVLVDPQFLQWNKTHVIATKEQGTIVKRIQKSDIKDSILLVSDNPDFPPFDIPRSEITGIALVLGIVRVE